MSVMRRNNVHVQGDGRVTMVFAHGFGCDLNMWRLLAPAYASRYRTVLFDHVGSGASDLAAYDVTKYASLQGYANDVNELVAELGGGPVVFVGHSVSAMIGMLANLSAPELYAAQIMIGPSPCYINDGDYVGGFTRADIEGLLHTLESNYLGWSSNMAPAIMGAPDRPELEPPTLVVQCSDDLIAPVAVGDYMHRVLRKSTLAVIENVGHCPHLSAPSSSAAAIDAFLTAQSL